MRVAYRVMTTDASSRMTMAWILRRVRPVRKAFVMNWTELVMKRYDPRLEAHALYI
jgi:hypothetical protein